MKRDNLWHVLMNRFFMLFNLTKKYERPSNDKASSLHTVKGIVLPNKETVMIDEFSGYTKTRIQIQSLLEGTLDCKSVIEICEPYYEGYYGGSKCTIVHESYEPLIVGETYTFFLSQDEKIINGLVHEESNEKALYKELYHKAS